MEIEVPVPISVRSSEHGEPTQGSSRYHVARTIGIATEEGETVYRPGTAECSRAGPSIVAGLDVSEAHVGATQQAAASTADATASQLVDRA
jgi:hypothetical protein